MKIYSAIIILLVVFFASFTTVIDLSVTHSQSVDSLGACQGVSRQNNTIFLYGDRETGMIREYKISGDSLVYLNREMRLTQNDTDVINHPTGIAFHSDKPVFTGNSIRLKNQLYLKMEFCV